MSDQDNATKQDAVSNSELIEALAPDERDNAIDRGSHCTNFWCDYYNPEYLWACRGTLRNGDPAVSTCKDYAPEGFGG